MKKNKKQGLFTAFKLLWNISNTKEKIIFISLLLLGLLRSIAKLVIPLVTACIIARFSGQPAKLFFIYFPDSISNFGLIAINFAVLFSLQIIATAVRAGTKLFSTKMMTKVNATGLSYILEDRKNFNLNMTTGEASYIIKSSSEATSSLIEAFLTNVLVPIITAIITLVYIACLNIFAFIIVLGTMGIIALIIYYRIYYDKKVFKMFEKINGKVNNHAINNIENLPIIGFIKSKMIEMDICKELNKQYYKYEKKRVSTYMTYWSLIYTTQFICTCGVCILISNNLSSATEIVSLLIVIIPYLMDIFSSIENMAFVIGNCQQHGIKISRLLMLKANPENLILLKEDINQKNDEPIKEVSKLPNDTQIEKISINNLKVSIGDFNKEYQNIDFYKGQINVLAGGSGSGKTTLINCLLGLKEYEIGDIIINDKFKLQSLFFESDKISFAFQGERFFDRSILENLMYPQKELNKRAKELVKTFELDGILNREESDPTIKNTLSGGEKKRISFIRCLSKDAQVYILDEPTNELDLKNVNKMLKEINQLKENSIVIVISHDKRVLEISDNIITL